MERTTSSGTIVAIVSPVAGSMRTMPAPFDCGFSQTEQSTTSSSVA